jgi:His-Xaa-Ser system protein HxsD
MIFKFSKEFYPKIAIEKAAYFFVDNFFVMLDADEKYYLVKLDPKSDSVDSNIEKEFQNEVLAQVNRYVISQETKNIRELIIGRALASTMIDKRDEGYIDDESINADDILVNWFDKNE